MEKELTVIGGWPAIEGRFKKANRSTYFGMWFSLHVPRRILVLIQHGGKILVEDIKVYVVLSYNHQNMAFNYLYSLQTNFRISLNEYLLNLGALTCSQITLGNFRSNEEMLFCFQLQKKIVRIGKLWLLRSSSIEAKMSKCHFLQITYLTNCSTHSMASK